MESTPSTNKSYQLNFIGNGSSFFSIIAINWLLTAITLGFYYPWAKEKKLKYLYGSTTLNNDHFQFLGTGKEMFKGYIKALVLMVVLFAIFIGIVEKGHPNLATLVLYLSLAAILPFAIHGTYRYRMSKTIWRGIRFGYRGDRNELVRNFFTWVFYTIISFGIYAAWFTVNLRNYIFNNIRLGDIEFKSKAKGDDYFWLNVRGYFFTIFTLGIYMFWWQANLFNFYINNLSLEKGEQTIELRSTATAGGFFKLIIVNLLIIVFTFGFGYAWAVTRTLKFITSNIQLEGDIDLDTVFQTEASYNDATGEDISDYLNSDIVI